MKSWLPSFPFFTLLRICLFLLVRFDCTVTSTGHQHRLINNLHLGCPSLQPLWRVSELSQRLGSGLMYRSSLCQSLMMPSWQRSLTLILSHTVIRVAGSQLEVNLQVLVTLGRRGSHGGWCSWCVTVFNFITIIIITYSGQYTSKFFGYWRSIICNRFVLNMVKGHHLQLMCCPSLFHYFRQFNIKATLVHHPIIQKEVDELVAKGAIKPSPGGAGFSQMYLLLLNILLAYNLYSTLSNLIISTYLFPRCLLSDRYGSLFNRAIMLFILISVMVIYIFLLLSITITVYTLVCNTDFINGRFCHLGQLWDLRFSPYSLNPYYSFPTTRIFVLLFIWMISWSWLTISMLDRELFMGSSLITY